MALDIHHSHWSILAVGADPRMLSLLQEDKGEAEGDREREIAGGEVGDEARRSFTVSNPRTVPLLLWLHVVGVSPVSVLRSLFVIIIFSVSCWGRVAPYS